MNLAITLLVAVAIASVIGTVLEQGKSYQDYIIEFGTFWFNVFRSLGLYDVYGTGWFMAIMGFLVVSTSVCIYRHAPSMLREMGQFREDIQEKSLRALPKRAEWTLVRPAGPVLEAIEERFKAHGYRVRRKEHGDHTVVAAMKGSVNRLGYLFTHAAIVVICLGSLINSNVPLKVAELGGKLRPETRDMPVSKVPAISRLPASNPSFRGNVSIPEGSSANVVFINMGAGYLVQQLPFTVEVKHFLIKYYSTGMPRLFQSNIVIRGKNLPHPLERTISVNHPLFFNGYAIYQASFGDGGSKLAMDAWPLDDVDPKPLALQSAVNQDAEVRTPWGPMRLEFDNFRLFNVNQVPGKDGKEHFKNFGPSFTFKLRRADGQATEYINYMSPVEQQGRLFYLSGMRSSPAQGYRYLYVPAGPNGGLKRFIRFNALLHDTRTVHTVAERTARQALTLAGITNPKLDQVLVKSTERLVNLFARGGFQAIIKQVQSTVPVDRRKRVQAAYMKVLQNILGALYLADLQREGVDTSRGVNPQDTQFFNDAVNAIGSLPEYRSPLYLQLTGFKQIQASGLQITRAPGKNVVYFGFALLISGVFMMLYIANRRLWARVAVSDGKTQVLLAASSNRNTLDFAQEFDRLRGEIDARLTPGAGHPESGSQ